MRVISEQLAATKPQRVQERQKRRRIQKVRAICLPVLGIAIVFIMWQLYVTISGVPLWQLPPPGNVLSAVFGNFSLYLPHFLRTFMTIGVGWAVACSIGITLAALMSNSKLLSITLTPYINLLCVLPIIAVVPMMYVLWGASFRVFLIAIIMQSFAINVLNSITGFLNVPLLRTELMDSLRATRVQTFFKSTFPSSLSNVFTGMKMSSIFATLTCIGAEMTGSKIGLGAFLLTCKTYGRTDQMLGSLLLIAVIGVFFYMLMDIIQGLFIKWRE